MSAQTLLPDNFPSLLLICLQNEIDRDTWENVSLQNKRV